MLGSLIWSDLLSCTFSSVIRISLFFFALSPLVFLSMGIGFFEDLSGDSSICWGGFP